MGQYFENDNNLGNQRTRINYTYYGNLIEYIVDLGVFSKTRIDFGTNLLLQSLPKFTTENILDIGCGYGAIGLAIAKAFPKTKVDMCDVNLRALNLTKENSSLNHLHNVNIFESDVYSSIEKKYNFIITNPPIRAGKKVVYGMVINAKDHLEDTGKIIVVIQKKQGALTLIKAMETEYAKVSVINKDNGYLIIQGEI